VNLIDLKDTHRLKPLFDSIRLNNDFHISNDSELEFAKQLVQSIYYQKKKIDIKKKIQLAIVNYQCKKRTDITHENLNKTESTANTNPIPAFPCMHKTAYDNKDLARRALAVIRNRENPDGTKTKKYPKRAYECPFCGKYHLTSQPLPDKPKKHD
jgi:hypothetical protein